MKQRFGTDKKTIKEHVYFGIKSYKIYVETKCFTNNIRALSILYYFN
jgi:hypothetical protein